MKNLRLFHLCSPRIAFEAPFLSFLCQAEESDQKGCVVNCVYTKALARKYDSVVTGKKKFEVSLDLAYYTEPEMVGR